MIYINVIKTAIYLFPLLALLLIVPYMIWEYRKYGAILVLRTMIVYSLAFYLLCAYFLTILPLPSIESVKEMTTPVMELRPFHAFGLIFSDSPLVLSDPSTYLATLRSNAFLQVFFNILLVLPFGVYLRYYFKRSLLETFLLSFLLSLSFELIQLSALFGIYPRPYRLFEVDDLICNTLGGLIGYALTPLCTFFLPKRERLDEMAYQRGRTVSILRRLLALGIDFFLIILFTFVIGNVLGHARLIQSRFLPGLCIALALCFMDFILIAYFSKGYTIGKAFVKIKLKNTNDHSRPKFSALLIRYILIAITYFIVPVLVLSGSLYLSYMFINRLDNVKIYVLVITLVLIVYYVFELIETLAGLFVDDIKPLYIKLSKLDNVSMVKKDVKSDE